MPRRLTFLPLLVLAACSSREAPQPGPGTQATTEPQPSATPTPTPIVETGILKVKGTRWEHEASSGGYQATLWGEDADAGGMRPKIEVICTVPPGEKKKLTLYVDWGRASLTGQPVQARIGGREVEASWKIDPHDSASYPTAPAKFLEAILTGEKSKDPMLILRTRGELVDVKTGLVVLPPKEVAVTARFRLTGAKEALTNIARECAASTS